MPTPMENSGRLCEGWCCLTHSRNSRAASCIARPARTARCAWDSPSSLWIDSNSAITPSPMNFMTTPRQREVVVGAEVPAAAWAGAVVERREEDERNFGKTRLGSQRLEHGESVHLRHHHVTEDEIGRIAARQLQADTAVFCSGRGVTFDLQHQHDVVADAGLVLDDEDFLFGFVGHQLTPAGCLIGRRGIITVNRVPEPTALVRLISPP